MEWGVTGFREVRIEPYFFEALDYAEGSCDTCNGRIAVSWKRAKEFADGQSMLEKAIELTIEVPAGMKVTFRDKKLMEGTHKWIVTGNERSESRWDKTRW